MAAPVTDGGTCAVGMQYFVFKKVARDVAEANGFTFADSPHAAYRAGCRNLILVDNVTERAGFIAGHWRREVGGDVVFYAVTEGPPTISPRAGYGRALAAAATIVAPSNFARQMIEEAGFRVEAVVPHGARVPERARGLAERKWALVYRAYYMKRKFPPYGISAVRLAVREGIPVEVFVRDALHPQGLEPRHQALRQVLQFTPSPEEPEEMVYDQLSSYAFFLNLADGGGFELEVLESMALGTPVVTAYFPPISEYYPKNELTFDTVGEWEEHFPYLTIVHHEYRPEDMLEAMRRAISMDRRRWESLSSELRERAKEYDYRKVYQAFARLVG